MFTCFCVLDCVDALSLMCGTQDPDYIKHVTNPMDFQTIMDQLDARQVRATHTCARTHAHTRTRTRTRTRTSKEPHLLTLSLLWLTSFRCGTQYADASAFAADVQQVVDCSLEYYHPSTEEYAAALAIEKEFQVRRPKEKEREGERNEREVERERRGREGEIEGERSRERERQRERDCVSV